MYKKISLLKLMLFFNVFTIDLGNNYYYNDYYFEVSLDYMNYSELLSDNRKAKTKDFCHKIVDIYYSYKLYETYYSFEDFLRDFFKNDYKFNILRDSNLNIKRLFKDREKIVSQLKNIDYLINLEDDINI